MPVVSRLHIWYGTYVLSSGEVLTRRCSRCGEVRPLSDFNGSSEFGYQFYCRSCQRAWYREHREQHIANVNANTERYRVRYEAFVLEYLSTHPCVDCGESDPDVLEFDHVRGKTRVVSKMTCTSLEALIAEIERCEVRCVNCHMRRTADQFRWRKSRAQS
jgi:hypothetical protein